MVSVNEQQSQKEIENTDTAGQPKQPETQISASPISKREQIFNQMLPVLLAAGLVVGLIAEDQRRQSIPDEITSTPTHTPIPALTSEAYWTPPPVLQPPIYLTEAPPLVVPKVESSPTPEVQLSPEQKAKYDEITAIYAKYGIRYLFTEEDILLDSRKADEPVYDSGVILVEAEERDISKVLQLLGLFKGVLGDNTTRYINKLVYTESEKQAGWYYLDPDKAPYENRIIGASFYDSFGRVIGIHEAIHAVDRNYRIQDTDTYLRMQLIKAKLTLELTDPHSVWYGHYSDRYNTYDYSPYKLVGEYVKYYIYSETPSSVQNELLEYMEGLEKDGFYSETDEIYVGLKALKLKRDNPDYVFSDDLEHVFSVAYETLVTECLATIVTSVLMGTGYFADQETTDLVREFISIARGDEVTIKSLQDNLRYGYYNGELDPAPYQLTTP